MYPLGLNDSQRAYTDYSLRDIYKAVIRPEASVIDNRDALLPIKNQETGGTCAGQAYSYLAQIMNKQGQMSALFAYDGAKTYDPDKGEGTTLKAIGEAAVKLGICRELLYRYSNYTNSDRTIPTDAITEAGNFKAKTYAWVYAVEEIEAAIAQHGGVLAGIRWFTSYDTAPKGVLSIPGSYGRDYLRGGHGICLCGYNRNEGMIDFANSWGPRWGNEGFGKIPYELISWAADGTRVFSEGLAITDLPSLRLPAKIVTVTEGEKMIHVDLGDIKTDVPAEIRDGRFTVEVRHLLEGLGYKGEWNDATRTGTFTYIG